MTRTLPLLAAVVAVAGEAVAIAASPAGSARWNEVAVAAVVVAYAGVGALILWHRPGHPVGRIATAIAPVWGVGQAFVATSYRTLEQHPHTELAALGSVTGSLLRALPWLVAVLWLPLRFPDGARTTTRLHRVAERTSMVTIAGFTVATLFAPHLTDLRVDQIRNPIGAPGPLGNVANALAGINLLLGAAAIGLAIGTLVQGYRRGGPLTRQQTLIFGMAFLLPIAGLVSSIWDAAGPWLFGAISLPLPVAIGVAVLQRRLYDLPLLVNRSLTYGSLWLVIAALYGLVVGGVGAMLRQQHAAWIPWLAAGVVAVTFSPLREALQAAANRLTYGQWSQPGEVLAATARRLGDASDVPALLGELVEDVGAALDLPFVAITSPDGRVLAARGDRPDLVDELPMTSYGVPVGVLSWARRPLRESDLGLLDDLARQLGTVVHAAGLLESVRSARERLVLAREEERRRLRRELHDGLGPALAGLTLQVDTVRNRVADQGADEGADQDLLALRSGIQATVVDVRRIVEGLRPAALDDLGLAEAVRQLAAHTELPVAVEADDLPRLPAATEVAAYRIVQEALTNAGRHAHARRACVRLHLVDGALVAEVADDGSGVVTPRPDGVGLGSMRSRAEEIGGSFELAAAEGRGTRVIARLPLDAGAVR
ncbi:sensor histidine kinase [Nocardioides pocheonensis]|uniref:Sensor histidine kinase n=1 Tax=Nocardioides pocheonensis TaxID=661485 RepID=A0A3N0GV63_9ACTN|nr:sensor histidine kinase [Nocardioides pocheonensis]RNM16345.1 sensor histidine kinase [Nocardioides pocheonensis]